MHKQKRIVIVVTSYSTAVRFVTGFAEYLAKLGHEVTIISSPGKDPATILASRGSVQWNEVSMMREPSLLDLVSLVRLTKTLLFLKPDILLYATPKAALLSAIAGCIAGVPKRVYLLWGLRLETVGGLGRRILYVTEKITSRLSMSILANSPSLRKKYIELGLARRAKVEVLGNGSSHGVDLNYFSSEAAMGSVDETTREFLQTTSGLTVGFIGRLHPDKGVDTLIQAAIEFTSAGEALRLILVGPDEGAKASFAGQNIPPSLNIHWAGATEDPRPYIREFDAIVLMSLREGFPNVILEAAAMGVPAIVSNATGVIDSVVDGCTGLVVNVGDSTALSKVFEEVDGSSLKQMGRLAQLHVKKHFDQESVWDLYARSILK